MATKIQNWGNSQGLRISKEQLKAAQLEVGDEVEVEVRDGLIVIGRVLRVRGRYRLEELVRRIPEGYEPAGEEWDGPVGKEVW